MLYELACYISCMLLEIVHFYKTVCICAYMYDVCLPLLYTHTYILIRVSISPLLPYSIPSSPAINDVHIYQYTP